jgi:hypothetical protein
VPVNTLEEALLQELGAATTVAMMATGLEIAKQVIGGISATAVDSGGILNATAVTAHSWIAGSFQTVVLIILIFEERTVCLGGGHSSNYLLLLAVDHVPGPEPQGAMAKAAEACLAAGVWATGLLFSLHCYVSTLLSKFSLLSYCLLDWLMCQKW